MKRSPVSAATPAQRDKCRDAPCVVCGRTPCDPAHLLPRSLTADRQDDVLAVIPLCRYPCHQQYDQGLLDLSIFDGRFRKEAGFAVERYGIARTYRRVSNQRLAA